MRNALFLLALAAATPAAAQVSWYAGIALGQARTDRELVANRESTLTAATNLSTAFDARDTAWKTFAGLRFNPVLALELTYADLGEHRMVTSLQGGDPPFPASIAIDRRISGYGLDVVATAPLGWRRVDLFARAGVFHSRLEATAALAGNIVFTGGDPNERERKTTRNETVLKYGVGAECRLARNLALRLEWERYSSVGKPFAIGGSGTTGEADTDVASLGITMRF
jgi:opacity protein-like surface antigen